MLCIVSFIVEVILCIDSSPENDCYSDFSGATVDVDCRSRHDWSWVHSRLPECICSRHAVSRLQYVGKPELETCYSVFSNALSDGQVASEQCAVIVTFLLRVTVDSGEIT